MEAIGSAWRDPKQRRGLIVLAILVVAVVAYVIYAAGWNAKNDDGSTTNRYQLTKAECTALYDGRIGHDPNDNPFWAGLVDCANAQLLPPGQNDPGFYSR